MKRGLILSVLFLFLIVLPLSYAAPNLQIEKVDKGSVIISELNNPAVFDFKINNLGEADRFQVYSLLDVTFSPVGLFELPSGQSTIEVKAYPGKELRRNLGFLKFEYELKGEKTGIYKDTLNVKVVELKNVFEISPLPLKPSDNQVSLLIKNKENTNIKDLKVHLKSSFFDVEETLSFKPNEGIVLNITLDKSKTKSLLAGKYIVGADIQLEKAKAEIEGLIDYLEENSISVDKTSSGLIIKKVGIIKTNVGNVPAKASIELNKDVISRLFTVYSISPMTTERNGLNVRYLWEKTLNPGESFAVTTTTNYTFPLVLIILIVLVVVFAKVYSLKTISVEKRVSYVKTKGGQFALKVTLHVKARKHTDNIQIIDKLPEMTKLYEKFGKMPNRIDHSTRRLFWDIPRLNKGEERVFSYILYSGLNIVGRFELPAATAVFERDGKTEEVYSNRAFFAVDTATRKEY